MSEDGLDVKESVSRGSWYDAGMGIRDKVSERIFDALRQHLENRIPVGYKVKRKRDFLYIYQRRRFLPDKNLGDVVRMFEDDKLYFPYTISYKIFPAHPWPWITVDDLKAILQPFSHYIHFDNYNNGKVFVTRDTDGRFTFARFTLRSPRDLGDEAIGGN